jgi:multimeric flavodoxin WrbA
MNILVLESSPHRHGSSNMIAEEFARGAEEHGHDVTVIDVARKRIGPCMGCDRCRISGECVQDDDMVEVRDAILATDMVVFATPLYYFGMTAQLKTVIDRFYAFNGKLMSRGIKSLLITVAWDSSSWTMQALEEHYKILVRYLHFENVGEILGVGCGTVDMTAQSNFPARAYALGKSLE